MTELKKIRIKEADVERFRELKPYQSLPDHEMMTDLLDNLEGTDE